MGTGIAMNFLQIGLPVVLLEQNQAARDRGLASIRKTYESNVKRGSLRAEQLESRMALLNPALDYGALADCDLIVEAVFEEMSIKQSVFQRLDAVARPGAILATNTSTLDVDRIAACTQRPQDVLGLHFFSPAHIMKLLEVVRGQLTAPDVLASALQLARRIGKTAVVARVCDGFIGNRMIEQYSRQAGFLLEEGALPAQVDAAMERFGFAMGPFRMSDLAGNDIGWAIRKRRALERPGLSYPQIFDRICEAGRFGQKTGAGWYDYRAGDRNAHPSEWVDACVLAHSARLGITRRTISDVEIVERLVYALVNEGAHLLEEGIATRASDIDVVYLSGYGFPRHRGGPMRYADEMGLPAVIAAMQRFAAADPQDRQAGAWAPAPLLLRRLADSQTLT
jgi:3-hydroxyacyl-CoA dehydrogenase